MESFQVVPFSKLLIIFYLATSGSSQCTVGDKNFFYFVIVDNTFSVRIHSVHINFLKM